jgi:hypothetical protein
MDVSFLSLSTFLACFLSFPFSVVPFGFLFTFPCGQRKYSQVANVGTHSGRGCRLFLVSSFLFLLSAVDVKGTQPKRALSEHSLP